MKSRADEIDYFDLAFNRIQDFTTSNASKPLLIKAIVSIKRILPTLHYIYTVHRNLVY
jgi:hypothetical protein